MYYKKILPMFFCVLCGLAAVSLWSQEPQAKLVSIDKIAAVVNDEIITLTDIDKYIQIYPVFRSVEESDDYLYERVLDELIHNKVVTLEYRSQFILTDEDYEDIQTQVVKKAGSFQNLMQILKSFDMEWQDFKDFIKEKVIFEKVVRENFQMKITIQFKEIEEFYNQVYLPTQEKLNLTPRSLIEMAPLIEEHLRKMSAAGSLSGWLQEIMTSYKVENLLKEEQNEERR